VKLGTRVAGLTPAEGRWQVGVAGAADAASFDAVILATPPQEAGRLAASINAPWADMATALQFESITTVYARGKGETTSLRAPMRALRSSAQHPGQFVFDRDELGGNGLLAFVVSASSGERADIEARVLAQAREQLGMTLEAVQTVVEKRATFACTPGLLRPGATIAPRLLACGDYVQGPYPATLEGAVRSGRASVQALS
jgi:hydroxysqualene dehydroxylase